MVGTRKLLRLLDHAERAGAKVVLVGDPRQLPEIEAGGAFAVLAQRLEPAKLAENRRQHEPWELAALTQLRAGDTDQALDAYQAHGRIHHAPDPGSADGATMGRTMVLADDTLTRELAYVALSRGRGRNDLYLGVDDDRAADRHHPETLREPVQGVRDAVRRSGAKTMAIGESLHPVPTLPAGPPPSRVAADLRSQLTHLERELQRAEQRRDDALDHLDHLPRLRRFDRRRLKDRHTHVLDRATSDIEKLTESIAENRSHLRRVDKTIDQGPPTYVAPSLGSQREDVVRRLDALERQPSSRVPSPSISDDFGIGL
jgi:hypothetical protein